MTWWVKPPVSRTNPSNRPSAISRPPTASLRVTLAAGLEPPARQAAVTRSAILFWLVAVLALSAGLGLRDPWPADEPRFALIARDMAAGGDWLFPRRNGELYADKPPLGMWLMALGMRVGLPLGVAFLLPSLLAGLATLALVRDLATRLWGRRCGVAAGWALLLSAQFAMQARVAQLDALVCLWTTLALYGLLRHLLAGRASRGDGLVLGASPAVAADAVGSPNSPVGSAWGWCWLGCAAMGLGVISKAVGFLPLLILIPWGLMRWRGWPRLAPSRPGEWWRVTIAAFCLLAPVLAWLLPMLAAASGDQALEAYRDNILFKQTAKRYATPEHHFQPLWFFLWQAPLLWLPLPLLLPWLAPWWWRAWRRRDVRVALPLAWVGLVVLFFSISPAKRAEYVLPALPALVLAMAGVLPALAGRGGVARVAGASAWLLTVMVAVAACLGAWEPTWLVERLAREGLAPALFTVPLAAGALLAASALLALRRHASPVALLIGLVVGGWMLYGWWLMPGIDRARSPREFMRAIGQQVGVEAELGMVRFREQYVLTADRPITTFGYERRDRDGELRESADWLAAAPGRRWLLVPAALAGAIADPARCRAVGRRHGTEWLLAGSDALR